MTDKTKQYLFRGSGILASLLPLGITIGVNNQAYFKDGNTTNVSIGLLLVAVMVAMYTSGKVEFIKGIRGAYLILFVGFFLQSMINDFVLLWGMYVAGETVSIPLNAFANKYKKINDIMENAKYVELGKEKFEEEKVSIIEKESAKKKKVRY